MTCDYHLHTSRCGHARGTMEEYVLAARDKGLKAIGFADHFPLYWLPAGKRDPSLAMEPDELPGYIEEVRRLQKKYPGIKIKLGIEVDYIPGFEGELARLLRRYPFDYVLGSVHYIDGWGFDNPAYLEQYRDWDTGELYKRYFQLVRRAALSGLFDVIAHPDLIKKFGYRPRVDLLPLYRETATVFKQAGVLVEVNTAGLRAPAGEIYPAPAFVHECVRQGLRFTTGSDAHAPEQVGEGLNQVRLLVSEDRLVEL